MTANNKKELQAFESCSCYTSEISKTPKVKVRIFIFQTQVCVLQTTMDLLERNYTVHVLADGVSSRTMVERMFALEVTHLFNSINGGTEN